MSNNQVQLNQLADAIVTFIEQARGQVRHAVNSAMVQSYWQIGRLIVEDEQQDESRAAYGKQQLQQLSQTLTARLGKGFDVTNLRNMRSFYQAFPIRETVSLELSWSHCRIRALTHRRASRVKRLEERNGAPLQILTKSVDELSDKIAGHLKGMGLERSL